ncbi:DUF4397 domain-containing protein [Chitiniphilus purpureus]|uniref:DUF4397 domain-containing protein n=1 Tax=Chitiniphilus purpureus TaxID=2981137 RepID=A0ABY6DNA3_9NEIS|nr:DUF4397 domain-containing protein [Chitiniphilus sp. CD1]UXY15840.1 DUF4397 domain-containing protein [Chitiniphilus sp. CD1]
MKQWKQWLTRTVLAATALGLAACNGSDGDNSDEAKPTAQIRVVHASPDAPNVDVYANGSRALANVPYKAASALLTVPAGNLPLRVTVAGTDTAVDSFTDALPALEAGKIYTVFAAGRLAQIAPLAIVEDNLAPAAGQLKLRVVHAAPSAGNVDIYLTAPDADLATATPALGNVAFRADSGVLPVAAGSYRVRITPAGSKTVAYDSGTLDLAAGADLVVAAVETENAVSPVSLLLLTRNAAAPVSELKDARARVRAIHAISDAPAVDVLANGAALFSGVSYYAVSDYAAVPAAAYTVTVATAAGGTEVISQALTLDRASSYSVFAIGLAAGSGPTAPRFLVAADNLSLPATGSAKVRVVHASPGAPNVDIYANGNRVLANVPYPAASDYLEVPAGSYTFDVRPAGDAATVVQTLTATLEANRIYTVVARGVVGSSGAAAFTLSPVVDR